jgi:hypothetical protein
MVNPGRHKRVISIRGSNEDTGVYYRCWNCGFICDSTRDQIGDGDGVSVRDAPEYHTGYESSQDSLNYTPGIRIHGMMAVTLENGPDGDPITTYRHNKYPKIGQGCPLCGCKNYR